MKLTLDKKQGNRVEFICKDVSTSLANLVRRYSISRVDVFAIDVVTFYDNTSAFWDEYIAHRLGLMPITTPANTPLGAEVIFSLDAEGPKMVHASEMVSSDKEITIAKGDIPIVTLGPNQHLRFEAKAVVGQGRRHAKYQAGLVTYGSDGEDLRFIAESFFQMEPAEVLFRGCDAIESDLVAIEAALGKKPPEKKKAPAKKAKKPKAEKKTEEKEPGEKEEKKAKAEGKAKEKTEEKAEEKSEEAKE